MNKRVDEWLRFAAEDLKVAQICFKEEIYNQSCFHAQQCAEKSLKAMVENNGKVPKLHRLLDLLEIPPVQESNLDIAREDFEFLDKFYTVTRYPFIVGILPAGLPGESDAKHAIEIAELIYKKVSDIIS